MSNRLYRSESNRVLGGVCAGLGGYLGVDPLLIRIFFVLWTILGELSILVYFILWLVIPRENTADTFHAEDMRARFSQLGREISQIAHEPSSQLITYTGVGLIGWGVYYLLQRFGFPWISWDYTSYLWPALLILAGGFVLLRTLTKRK